MANEIVQLKSIIKAENIELNSDSFGGELDPMCCTCQICCSDACNPSCVVCASFLY